MMQNITMPYTPSKRQQALVPVRQPNQGRYSHNQNNRLAQQNNFGKVFSALVIIGVTIGICSFILTKPTVALPASTVSVAVQVPQVNALETVRPRTVAVAAPVEAPIQPEVSIPVAAESPVVSTQGDGPIKVRLGPGQGYSVFATLPDGEDASVMGHSVDGFWWKIDFQGQMGWISTAFVKVTGDVNTLPVITDQPLLYPAQVN